MKQKFYIFARYDYLNSMFKTDGVSPLEWCKRSKISAGFNWYPIKQVVVKGEYTYGILDKNTTTNLPSPLEWLM